MSRDGFAADYIPVNERIAAFYAKHPDGSLQSELVELSESRVVMRAYAYRSPEDTRPGIGYSSLEIPGRTPYTRGSEVENCETSAWGRAIAALGFEVKRGIATAEDVRNKSDEPERPTRQTPPPRSSTTLPDIEEPDDLAEAFGEVRAFAPIDKPEDAVPDNECPIHRMPWAGKPGDLWHKDPAGRYCRHPDNVKRRAS
jgi:hypothetical protein